VRSASECVRWSHCAARHRPDTERTCLAVGPTQFIPPRQTRQNSPVCVVSGVAVWSSLKSQFDAADRIVFFVSTNRPSLLFTCIVGAWMIGGGPCWRLSLLMPSVGLAAWRFVSSSYFRCFDLLKSTSRELNEVNWSS